ncbi:hypothetical protein EYF80_050728 [Liparis tanakae]|uniref:Uncharacterized protein n=1 Tax=Liparis tanakae TaxID=230148 RepID=A0A4Z2FE90_9TELE|nr:hypothetical protein EYF80_050728 [Liparis tanakae]
MISPRTTTHHHLHLLNVRHTSLRRACGELCCPLVAAGGAGDVTNNMALVLRREGLELVLNQSQPSPGPLWTSA